ncbi:hypothetical protein C8R45DRAFT_967963 [Mycena sanguinolenta]|nr:hypothetical protein C8R45DRAFT_967963 [Mycena sanguinolenta]
MPSRMRTASAGGACRCVRRGRNGTIAVCLSSSACCCCGSSGGSSSSPKPDSSPPMTARRSSVGCARTKARRRVVGSVRVGWSVVGVVGILGGADTGDGVLGGSGGKIVRLRSAGKLISVISPAPDHGGHPAHTTPSTRAATCAVPSARTRPSSRRLLLCLRLPRPIPALAPLSRPSPSSSSSPSPSPSRARARSPSSPSPPSSSS